MMMTFDDDAAVAAAILGRIGSAQQLSTVMGQYKLLFAVFVVVVTHARTQCVPRCQQSMVVTTHDLGPVAGTLSAKRMC